jgi:hypothetical protein
MKLIEYACGDVKVLALGRVANDDEPSGDCDRAPPHFEVDFNITVQDVEGGPDLCHRISVSTSILLKVPLADRFAIEDEAEEHLPTLLREVADEVEKRLARRGPRVRKS